MLFLFDSKIQWLKEMAENNDNDHSPGPSNRADQPIAVVEAVPARAGRIVQDIEVSKLS